MEEYINNPEVGIHLLQHILRSLCDENSLWIYAVFWRLLPRNHPAPIWDFQREARNIPIRGNSRNWMLAWEDGFCNFTPLRAERNPQGTLSSSSAEISDMQHMNGLQPHLFYKMSHEFHNYGEGLVGKVAADGVHKYVHDSEQNLAAWKKSGDQLHPKTWRAQFQSGIKTIALIAVEEGVLQLGAVRKVPEDFSYVVQLQKNFSHLLNIPGFLLPRPSISSLRRIHSTLWFPLTTSINFIHNSVYKIKGFNDATLIDQPQDSSCWAREPIITPLTTMQDHIYMNCEPLPLTFIPSMSSLNKLLCKLPSVVPSAASSSQFRIESTSNWLSFSQNPSNVGNGEDVQE